MSILYSKPSETCYKCDNGITAESEGIFALCLLNNYNQEEYEISVFGIIFNFAGLDTEAFSCIVSTTKTNSLTAFAELLMIQLLFVSSVVYNVYTL